MKLIIAAIAATIIAILAMPADADANVFCAGRSGWNDYRCYPVYAGVSWPTGANAEFYNGAPFTMNLKGWYAQGCSATPVMDIQIMSGQNAQHYAFDPFQTRRVLYSWCAYDATPGYRCNGGVAEPICTGNH